MAYRIFLPLAGLAALAGCATPDPQFGLVTQQNVYAQVVDMNPIYAGVPIEGGDGVHGVAAVRRYKTDEVKKLQKGNASAIRN